MYFQPFLVRLNGWNGVLVLFRVVGVGEFPYEVLVPPEEVQTEGHDEGDGPREDRTHRWATASNSSATPAKMP